MKIPLETKNSNSTKNSHLLHYEIYCLVFLTLLYFCLFPHLVYFGREGSEPDRPFPVGSLV